MFRFFLPLRDWKDSGCIDVDGVATLRCLPVLFQNIITILVSLCGVVALFLLVWGSIKFINSRGDPQKIDSARKTITYAVIGVIFILFSFFILNIISKLTGMSGAPGVGQ